MNLPDFRIPIEDQHAAEWWWQEWEDRYRATNDEAFKEQAEAMEQFIVMHFDDNETVDV